MKRLMQAFWYCFVIGCVAGNCSAQSTDRDKPGQNWDPIRSANVQESHKEQPTDPPAKPIPRHLKRTSPAKNRGFGPFQSVQVNIDAGGNNILGDAANEPSIAINSTNPDNIVVGWRQFDNISSNFRQAGMAYSFDGGQSWSNEGPLEAGVFRSDPVLGFDSQGTIYYYSLTIDNNNFVCDMFLSSDGGQSWSLPIPAGGGDKQWFTVDRSGGKGNGHIYAYWSQSFSCCPPGFFTRSTDFSMTFLYPIELPVSVAWGQLNVGPDGELFVTGQSGSDVYVLRSDDAQDSTQLPQFPQVATVPMEGGMRAFDSSSPNPGGLLGQLNIATDHSNGPSRGNVYVLGALTTETDDPLDIKFARSTDGGANWDAPIRINNDPMEAGHYNWFGTMAVAPNGRIDVIWNDMRDDPGGTLSAMYYSYSLDAGVSWSENVQVTQPFDSLIGHPNQSKIGDYYDMVSDAEAANVIYSATFNGEQDVYYLRIVTQKIVAADNFTIEIGRLPTGGVTELESSDDEYLILRPNFLVRRDPGVTVDFESISTLENPDQFSFEIESKVPRSGSEVTQTIQLFNYQTQLFETWETGPSNTSDERVTVVVTENPGFYVDPQTQRVKARVKWTSNALTSLQRWNVFVDQVNWEIVGPGQ